MNKLGLIIYFSCLFWVLVYLEADRSAERKGLREFYMGTTFAKCVLFTRLVWPQLWLIAHLSHIHNAAKWKCREHK